MEFPDPTLANLRKELSSVLAELLDSYQLKEHSGEEESATPPLLIDTFKQLFDTMQRTEADQQAGNPPGAEAVTELGEYALELFDQTLTWASRLKLPEVYQDLQATIVTMARWIAQHGGEIQSLEPVVDALAQFANTTQDSTAVLYRRHGTDGLAKLPAPCPRGHGSLLPQMEHRPFVALTAEPFAKI